MQTQQDQVKYYGRHLCMKYEIPKEMIIKHDDTYIYTRITKELRDAIHNTKRSLKEGEIIKVANTKERKDGKLIYRIKYLDEEKKRPSMKENQCIRKLTLGLSKVFKTEKKGFLKFNIMVYGIELETLSQCSICKRNSDDTEKCDHCSNNICMQCLDKNQIKAKEFGLIKYDVYQCQSCFNEMISYYSSINNLNENCSICLNDKIDVNSKICDNCHNGICCECYDKMVQRDLEVLNKYNITTNIKISCPFCRENY